VRSEVGLWGEGAGVLREAGSVGLASALRARERAVILTAVQSLRLARSEGACWEGAGGERSGGMRLLLWWEEWGHRQDARANLFVGRLGDRNVPPPLGHRQDARASVPGMGLN
jgi:hypothetical protein